MTLDLPNRDSNPLKRLNINRTTTDNRAPALLDAAAAGRQTESL
jgi:hypothetical protein